MEGLQKPSATHFQATWPRHHASRHNGFIACAIDGASLVDAILSSYRQRGSATQRTSCGQSRPGVQSSNHLLRFCAGHKVAHLFNRDRLPAFGQLKTLSLLLWQRWAVGTHTSRERLTSRKAPRLPTWEAAFRLWFASLPADKHGVNPFGPAPVPRSLR